MRTAKLVCSREGDHKFYQPPANLETLGHRSPRPNCERPPQWFQKCSFAVNVFKVILAKQAPRLSKGGLAPANSARGGRGRGFESRRPDFQEPRKYLGVCEVFLFFRFSSRLWIRINARNAEYTLVRQSNLNFRVNLSFEDQRLPKVTG